MAIVLTRRSHQRKPAGHPAINWSHPLAQGLIACVALGAQRNLVTGGNVSLATGTAGKLGQEGLILDATSVRYEATPLRLVGNALTLWGIVTPQGSGGRMAFAYGNEANGNSAIRVKSNGSSNWALHGWSNDHDSSTSVVNGRRVAVGVSLPASGNFTMYLDGRSILTGGTFAYGGTTHALAIGGGPDVSLESWNGVIEIVAAWDRALSATEHQWLAIEPWALLAAPRRWFVSTPAGGTTLAAGVNTIAFSAPVATLAVSGTAPLAAGIATITFTAPAATLAQPGLLLAGVNTITFSAPAAALQPSGIVALAAGVNTITFQAPAATIPGTGEFADWLSEIATSRIILCELQPAEALSGWTVVGGQPNTYSTTWPSIIQAGVVPGGVYRRIDTVKQNDLELTLRASIALVNANLGSWFYDEAAGTLYVSTTTASDPDTFAAIAAYFTLFLATQPVDFVGGQLYEPRLTGELPTVQASADDPFVAIKTLVEGTIQAVNAHAFFDVIADTYVWRNKSARLFLGGGDLPRASYAQIAACEIDYLAVADDTVKLGIRSLASWLEQTLPLRTFTRDEYPRLAESIEGSYKPLLYGAQRNVPGLCVDMYVLANPEFLPGVAGYQDVYLVADPAAQILTAVTGVRAVNRSSGELRGLSVSNYSVNLSACTVTVITDAFRADEWELRIDATGETDGAGGYLSTFGEIARDLLLTLGVPAADIDTGSFSDADARAPFPLGLWIREPVQAAEIVSLLQQSVIGGIFVGTDGRWRAYVLDASDDPDPVAELEDADLASWVAVERIDPTYPLVRCFFDTDPASGEPRLTTAQQDRARYLFETSDGLSVHTCLVEPSDAQIVAQRYRLLSTSPDHQFDVLLRGLALMTANAYDRLLVTRARAPGGSYVEKRMEILAITKTLGPPAVQVRLGDIAGISDLVGRIRAVAPDSIPDYALASAAERGLYAFVADDDGRVDPGDPSTTDHSVIW